MTNNFTHPNRWNDKTKKGKVLFGLWAGLKQRLIDYKHNQKSLRISLR